MLPSTSLLQMPDVAMGRILEKCDFESILVLRKVCHDLRNFIDVNKPASHLTEILVDVYPEYITFNPNAPRLSPRLRIDYKENGEGCLVKCKKDGKDKEKMVENEDFVTVFCNDFNIILRHQKTALEDFIIKFDSLNATAQERILENVSKSFKSLNRPLQVKSLDMRVNNQNEILSILPYIDPKALEEIDIHELSGRYDIVLNLDEIGQLEQWKQAENLEFHGFQLPDLSQNFKHFSRIGLGFRNVSAEELILLKEIFLCSSTLTTINLFYYGQSSEDVMRQRLIESFGQPFYDYNLLSIWFFRILDTNKFLRIKNNAVKYSIYFDRIEQSDLPQNAIILD